MTEQYIITAKLRLATWKGYVELWLKQGKIGTAFPKRHKYETLEKDKMKTAELLKYHYEQKDQRAILTLLNQLVVENVGIETFLKVSQEFRNQLNTTGDKI